jgi:hypothetical protein
MNRTSLSRLGVILMALASAASLGWQSLSVEVERNEAVFDYPNTITFVLEAQANVEIVDAELAFGTDALSCAETATRAEPEDFEPGTHISASLEWSLLDSGALPPGTRVWWQWTLTDAAGQTHTTPREEVSFLDASLSWRFVQGEHLTVYWLNGNDGFGRSLLEYGEAVTLELEEELGMDVPPGLEIYIFPDSRAMQDASLFLPAWSGGVAFPTYRRMMAAVGPGELDWGRTVVRHELTHVIIGQYTFSCVESTTPWVDEGLATYFEGPFRYDERIRLQQAIAKDNLFSVRELGYGFSNDPDLAIQAYAQSRSLVEYLLETYDPHLMLVLLDSFREGDSAAQALETAYGLSPESLDAAWRAWVGAPPRADSGEPTPTRTPVPTFAPLGQVGGPTATTAPSETPTEPPATPTAAPPTPTEPPPPPGKTAAGPAIAAAAVVVLLLIVLALAIRRRQPG